MKKRKVKRHKCVGCKKLFKEKEIEYSSDPYAEDIDGDTTKVWECESCREESSRDI